MNCECVFKFNNKKCKLKPENGNVFCKTHLEFLKNDQTRLYFYEAIIMLNDEIIAVKSQLEKEKEYKIHLNNYYKEYIYKLYKETWLYKKKLSRYEKI